MLYDGAVIGGADGPTVIFLAGELSFGWVNIFGLVFIVLLLIPNIIYALKTPDRQEQCTNRFMNILEQTGRYGCMVFMVLNAGMKEFGYASVGAFLVYIFGNAGLMIAYWIIWFMYFKKPVFREQIALAVIPVCMFLMSGITLRHYLLILFAVIFGIAHIYVTNKNRV